MFLRNFGILVKNGTVCARFSVVDHINTPNSAMNAPFLFDLMRAYEKRCFPWMQSIEDRDLIAIIGTHQDENSDGISCKQLYLADIAPVATVQRRVRRLIKLGILRKQRSSRDARVFYICLSGPARGAIEAYVTLLKRSALNLSNDVSFSPVAFSDLSTPRTGSYSPLPLAKFVKSPSSV
jgi:hypothetical protein